VHQQREYKERHRAEHRAKEECKMEERRAKEEREREERRARDERRHDEWIHLMNCFLMALVGNKNMKRTYNDEVSHGHTTNRKIKHNNNRK